jgi:hypothetical protein
MVRYEGTLSLPDRLHGWIEGTRCGAAVTNVRTVGTHEYDLPPLNEAMEFDSVIFSFGDGRIADVTGIWAPVYAQYQDEHGEWLDPVIEGANEAGWTLMSGYSGQHQYAGPWMHQSEFIGGRMAEDILATPGIYVAVYPSVIDENDEQQDPDTWAVAYISENIPGSMPGEA